MKIVLVSDAWQPQVNGVVTTLTRTCAELNALGHQVEVIGPGRFRTLPCPGYPSIRLAVMPGRTLVRLLDTLAPDAIHIATEGPLGQTARRYCLSRQLAFTTAYHTQFPEYLALRSPIPARWTYRLMRRFHAPAARTMVATASQQAVLEQHGFTHLARWSRGVDTAVFRPRDKDFLLAPRPIAMYVGRVAVEKNLDAFLSLDLPGSKYVVGDGPALPALRARYPTVRFTGFKHGEDLARHLAAADVFVFPSRTDTFGLVLLEAMASGVPVAAYPVTGPRDVVVPGVTGALHEDLGRAARQALHLDPAACVSHASAYSWRNATLQFLSNLAPLRQATAQLEMRPPRNVGCL
ncbi:MAG TPA: alpha-mannosyltransferase [Gammaproteobacteria bacterium]|uniref:glycosyltransferase family 4 protein n=1 Tax=Immundisolibacter sp. TaxID=1934948 RepID=UPI000E985615|nr:alpha-mannosyltransferase [Gammaproteobacteria bacterium]HCZ49133.1 alpha-mannosyltransferase [Gammaproteobacteria bacterium]MCH78571.1 alpha-mannosyltransferase [Gammaproteobacteria bacterium]